MADWKRRLSLTLGILCVASLCMPTASAAGGSVTDTSLDAANDVAVSASSDAVASDASEVSDTDGVAAVKEVSTPRTYDADFAPLDNSSQFKMKQRARSAEPQQETSEQGDKTLVATTDLQSLSSVAVMWNQSAESAASNPVELHLRYLDNQSGEWSAWNEIEPSPVQSDADVSDSSTQATEPVYVGDSSQAQVQAVIPAAAVDEVDGLRLITIDSGYQPVRASQTANGASTDGQKAVVKPAAALVSQASTDPNQPSAGTIHTRESWWRSGLPKTTWRPEFGKWHGAIVHHTDDRNNYSQAEAKVIVQNIYTFHTSAPNGRGWGDIGYQLLVDRFGGIWEGRDDDKANKAVPASNVIGAQARGFNSATFGISIIGTFMGSSKPTSAAINSVSSAIAWEFRAMGVSNAKDHFSYKGIQNRISGHGDAEHWSDNANKTDCPGTNVKAQYGNIRNKVQSELDVHIAKAETPQVVTQNGKAPTYPATVNVTYNDGTKGTAAVSWKKLSEQQYSVPDGASYDVSGTVYGKNGIKGTAKLHIVVSPVVASEVHYRQQINTTVGVAPSLPAKATVVWPNGDTTKEEISWETVDPSSYAQLGDTFTVTGMVARKTVTVTVTVVDHLNEVTAHFASQGGSAVVDQTVTEGQTITTPQQPKREHYSFQGWYTAAKGGAKFDFSDQVYEDFTLYAQWKRVYPADTLAVRRKNVYYFKNSISGGSADRVIGYGKPSDTVLVGDWDGDGRDTLAVRRKNVYYVKNSINGGKADKVVGYGKPSDQVIIGHFRKL